MTRKGLKKRCVVTGSSGVQIADFRKTLATWRRSPLPRSWSARRGSEATGPDDRKERKDGRAKTAG